MLESQLCKQCACIRHDLERDGYMLQDIEKMPSLRRYYYRHANGTRFLLILDLESISLTIYKNAHLHKIIK